MRKNTIITSTANYILLIIVFSLYSYYLISAYTDGDQRYYRAFYQALANIPFSDVMLTARAYIDSGEPLTNYLLWTAAQLNLDKDIFITFLNVILLLGLYLVAKTYNTSFITLSLLLTNFYIIVLMTSAERLKIAYILLVWSAYFSGKKSLTLIGITPLAHLQSFFIFPSLLLTLSAEHIKKIFTQLKINKSLLKIFIPSIILLVGFFLFFFEGILKKTTAYMSIDTNPLEMANLVILSLIAFIVTRNRWRMGLLLLPLYPAVLLLGGMRVNMIAVTLVLYFLMKERKLNHPFIVILLVYFSVKSIPFINKIFLYGNGFANI